MRAGASGDEKAVRAVVLDLYLRDRKAGELRPVSAYQDLFPEHRELVALAIAELEVACGNGVSAESASTSGAIGPYRLQREIGRGGQGIVYLAVDSRLDRRVALKVLPSLGPHAAELALRFRREAEVASRLDHPGICTVYEAGTSDGVLYIAMRYVEGETLAARIAARSAAARGTESAGSGETTAVRRRELAETLALFEKCAAALHDAHEAGVVHRDVKPGNVLIDRRGEPVLLDFGLAREEDDLAGLTRTGDLFGTPAYMAPEQLAGTRALVDRRTDVYSLGVCLYEAVTGRRPFDAPTRERLFQEILTREPPDPRRLRRGVPADLKVVLETALAKEPDRRYQSARDLAEDLRRARSGVPIRARPVSWRGRVLRWARRSPARTALVAVVAVGLPSLAGLGGFLLANRGELAAGRLALSRSRLERAVDRGFTALTWDDAAAEAALREALALDPASVEATVGLTLHLLQPMRLLQPPVAGAPAAPASPERVGDALAFLDGQERRIGRHPDILRARLHCLELAGSEEGAEALRREIGTGRSALGCVLEASRHWPVFLAMPTNCRAAAEIHRLASLACDLAPRPQIFHYQLRGAAASYFPWLRVETGHLGELVLERWPDDPDALLHAGALISNHDRPRGRALLEEVIRREPENAGAWAFLGAAWFPEDRERAVACSRRALAIGGPDRWVLQRLGIGLLTCGRPEEALEVFEEAIRLGEGAPEDLSGRGLAREALGDLVGAESDYRAALGLRAGYTGGDWFLGRLLAETGRVDEAIFHLRRAVEMDDLQDLLWGLLADALALAGRDAEARAAWEEATRRVPEEARAWNGLAWFLVDPAADRARWSPDVAVGAAERAAALSGAGAWWIQRTLGAALVRRGDDERAVEVLQHAAALQEASGRAVEVVDHAFLAVACARLGRREEAETALGRARARLAELPEDLARKKAADSRLPWFVPLRADFHERSAVAAVLEAEAALAAAARGEDPRR